MNEFQRKKLQPNQTIMSSTESVHHILYGLVPPFCVAVTGHASVFSLFLSYVLNIITDPVVIMA